MPTYRVVAPYVTLKVKDDAGSSVVKGYYAGAIVDNVDDEDQAKAQADLGLLEAADASAEPESPAEPAPPAKSASKADWVAYAVEHKGLSQEDAEKATRDELVELYGS